MPKNTLGTTLLAEFPCSATLQILLEQMVPRPWSEFLNPRVEVQIMDTTGQVFGNIQLALHKGPVDNQLRGLIWKAGTFPGLDLLPHRLEVPLHAVHPNREDVHEAQVLGVLDEHRCESAWDNVAKLEL